MYRQLTGPDRSGRGAATQSPRSRALRPRIDTSSAPARSVCPYCAKACPTESIQFGPLDELRERADRRLAELHGRGIAAAELYGRDPDDGVGGHGSVFLLLDKPEVYGLPPAPVVPTRSAPQIWRRVGAAAAAFALAGIGAFVSSAFGDHR